MKRKPFVPAPPSAQNLRIPSAAAPDRYRTHMGTLLATSGRRSPVMTRPLPIYGEAPVARTSSNTSLALTRKGFRPFFLLAALFAAAIVPAWLLILQGRFSVGGHFDPVGWHAHEMLFGYTVAVIAGFLLTAVGNWTQRETLVGRPLLALAALWVLGRLSLLAGGALPPVVTAVIDLSFLPALAVAIGRPILVARNSRNFILLGVLFALFVSNAFMHAAPLGLLPRAWSRSASLVAVDVIVLLLAVMAGRVFPMFTRNATGVSSVRSSPLLDALALGALALLVVTDAAMPGGRLAAAVLTVAALLAVARAVHWGARHTLREPLLWILHVGYAWIPVGLLLRAAANLGAIPESLGIHALTLGALGALTLGMMARVSLGHTGRPLRAAKPVAWAFAALTAAALVRVCVPLAAPTYYFASLSLAGALWALSFGLFLLVYTPILLRPRSDGKPG